MGICNKVWKKCPDCGGLGEMEIGAVGSIEDGHGFYKPLNLDDLNTIISQLDEERVGYLVEVVENEKWFLCQECREPFSLNDTRGKDVRIKILTRLL